MEIKTINDVISFVAMTISKPRNDAPEIFYKQFKDKLPREVLDHVLTII